MCQVNGQVAVRSRAVRALAQSRRRGRRNRRGGRATGRDWNGERKGQDGLMNVSRWEREPDKEKYIRPAKMEKKKEKKEKEV